MFLEKKMKKKRGNLLCQIHTANNNKTLHHHHCDAQWHTTTILDGVALRGVAFFWLHWGGTYFFLLVIVFVYVFVCGSVVVNFF